jgi:DNA-binding NarL/FixJ family response regulator
MRDRRIVRVVIADDQDLLRCGLKTMLEFESDIEVVGEASDGSLAISEVERTQPDVLLIDVMPKKGGIEAIREIKDACPNVGIVVLSLHDENQLVFDAVKVGASAYLRKTAKPEEVISTVRSVARGEAKRPAWIRGQGWLGSEAPICSAVGNSYDVNSRSNTPESGRWIQASFRTTIAVNRHSRGSGDLLSLSRQGQASIAQAQPSSTVCGW